MKNGRERSDVVPVRRLDRREALAALGLVGPAVLMACSSTGPTTVASGNASGTEGGAAADSGGQTADSASSSSDSGAGSTESGVCAEIPDERGGPYPDVDGMVSNTKYQRVDITEGQAGTPLSLTLQVLDVANGCAPIVGARVIIWHCDDNGVYSEYANPMNSDPAQNDVGSTTTTYLRGWQETDATGTARFTTIFPGWYSPRVTHIHVMVYNPAISPPRSRPRSLRSPIPSSPLCMHRRRCTPRGRIQRPSRQTWSLPGATNTWSQR
jgi:protocatechuate 3,4-dioxygenase beta subunit